MRVMQIGEERWKEADTLPGDVRWVFRKGTEPLSDKEEDLGLSDVVILDGPVLEINLPALKGLGAAYTYFYTDNLVMTEGLSALLSEKQAARLELCDLEAFVRDIPRKYFNGQHGSKIHPKDICLAPAFVPGAGMDGSGALVVTADFGRTFTPAASWRYNMVVFPGNAAELWLEYSASPGVEAELHIRTYRRGSTSDMASSATLGEESLRDPVLIEGGVSGAYIAASLFARGRGTLELGPFHFRRSRLGAGQFLAGGRRHSFDRGQEFISYFNPGDRKPPLNVYFSGYRTAEGFEGYFIMNAMKSPFLLIGDPRLEGGGFYLGSEAFEKGISDVIKDALDQLGFTKKHLILSGLSMGTFGAVYYGSVLEPRAIIIGKPLMNLGDVASNEKRLRPGGFPTSLDVLRTVEGGNGQGHAEALNRRLWDRFDRADFSRTEFAIGYMFQDDYDSKGFWDILDHLRRRSVVLVSKGLEGRHNDNTPGIVHWFMSQYRRILRDTFDREV